MLYPKVHGSSYTAFDELCRVEVFNDLLDLDATAFENYQRAIFISNMTQQLVQFSHACMPQLHSVGSSALWQPLRLHPIQAVVSSTVDGSSAWRSRGLQVVFSSPWVLGTLPSTPLQIERPVPSVQRLPCSLPARFCWTGLHTNGNMLNVIRLARAIQRASRSVACEAMFPSLTASLSSPSPPSTNPSS